MTEISLTDPEARQMKARHGVDACHSCHIAVEAGKHFIVGYTADNSTNDYWSTVPLAKESQKLLGIVEISADKGHFSLNNLEELSELGIKAYMPEAKKGRPKKKTGVPEEEFSKERFIYNPQDDTHTCPKGSVMHYRFLWPEVKTGTKYRVYSTDDCMKCPFKAKCTTSVRGRWITRWEKEEIEEEHWKRMKKEGTG
ncbi:MAG: transposase [Nitrososphaeria archaeon]